MMMNYEHVVACVLLAVATAAISMTVANAAIFARVREAILDRSAFFGALVGCPYCIAHWVALAFVGAYLPRPVQSAYPLLDYVVSWFVIVLASAFIGLRVGWSDEDE